MRHTRRRCKRNVKFDRKTRKAGRRHKMEDEQYATHDIDTIIEHLQTGGVLARGKTYSRTQAHRVIDAIIELGWRPEFVHDAFRRLDDQMLAEIPDRILIETYFKALIRRIGFQTSIRVSLTLLGLRPDVVDMLTPILEPLRNSSYTDIQVLDTAIYYLRGDDAPISPPNATHVIEPESVDTWIPYMYESKKVSIFNMSRSCATVTSSYFERILLPPKPAHAYFFHTSSWRGSLDIIEGVDHSRGRRCLDFGIYPGFYMSETADDCIDWATKKAKSWNNEVAILIFSVPDTFPPSITFKELYGTEWTDVTTQSRECKQSGELKSLKSIDLLYGNMVSNPTHVKGGRMPPLSHRPPKKQLVAKTDAADKFIYSCLVGCVYFKKNDVA